MINHELTNSQVLEVLPIPIMRCRWPDSDDINAELRNAILRKAEEETGLQISNRGGWHSSNSLHLWPGTAPSIIVSRAIRLAISLSARTCLLDPALLESNWDIEAWANVNHKGDQNAWHAHFDQPNIWSGVYYVDIGSRFEIQSLGAEIVFADRRRPRSLTANWSNECITIPPEPSLMLLFPSALTHKVNPFRGEGTRVSIAFNLRHPQLTTLHYRLADLRADRKKRG